MARHKNWVALPNYIMWTAVSSKHKLQKKHGRANVTYFTDANNYKNIDVSGSHAAFWDVLRVVWQMGFKVSEQPGASIYKVKKRTHSLILKMETGFSEPWVPIR
jgi:phage gp45-like